MLKYARIFDTPGYGSIVAEHEEVLKDFLPNSDFVVYTINYKNLSIVPLGLCLIFML